MENNLVHFNSPLILPEMSHFIADVIHSGKVCGNGPYTRKCTNWLEEKFRAQKILLTTSGSSALDMALLLCRLKRGDEVILPSFTFSSSANAIILAGGTPVFVDIRPDTMNIDEQLIEAAITEKTRAIMVVHYAGVSCDMDKVVSIAKRYHLKVIEDAAQAVMSQYKSAYLGTIGDFGCYSFHETKNYSMGEGGALVINNPESNELAEILWEKGTNRSKFLRGQIDKYTWVDFGDSYLPSELNAAYLWPQLLRANEILADRLDTWYTYFNAFQKFRGIVDLPFIPKNCSHNAHIFYLKLRNVHERTDFIKFLQNRNIQAVFHYVPLHTAPAGMKYGRFSGKDRYTTAESERLVRLPLYYGMKKNDRKRIIDSVFDYFNIPCKYKSV